VLSNAQLLQEVENAVRRQDRKEKLSALDQKRIELVSRARLFEALGEKQLPGMIPSSHNIKEHWLVPQDFASQTSAFSSPASLVAFINEQFQNHGIQLDRSKLDLEYTYNRVHFFRWAWMLYLASLLLAGWKVGQKKWPAALVLVGGAFLLHTTGFIFRCLIAGRPPVSNMYESVIWVSWAAVAFSWILYLFYRNHLAVMVASCVAIAGLLVGDGLPAVLDASLSPLVPVLKSNYWLTIHVLTITLSYGAFALAWGLAHAVLFNFAFRRRDTEKLKDLSLLLQRTLQIGVVLLAAGTILGGVWANYSWGRFWGWDPKETWALIALLGYLALLHGRYVGWWGAFGTAVGSLLAFFGIVMAWYGVNFVLAAGLHSYGFGVGGFPYVLAIIGADLTLLVFLVLKSKQAAT
jgi:cytochrome c-type biogenesis protein CcsB